MKIIISEYGNSFNLIAENNMDKAFIRNLWSKKVANKKNKNPFSINLYGHLFDQTDHWAKTPFQLEVSIHKSSGSAEGWEAAENEN